MPDDLRALLAAIVADPADDTARLAYADCLQEHGNTTRADFIRLQVEAERLHPDSFPRSRLEKRSEALFAEHWIEWWGEVCTAIGCSMPLRKPQSAIGRVLRRFGNPPGHPYKRWGSSIEKVSLSPEEPALTGWGRATFQRGFPCSVRASQRDGDPSLSFLQRWTTASPLDELHVAAPYDDLWTDGPHLSTLRRLTLQDYHPSALRAVLASPQLGPLEDLSYYDWQRDDDHDRIFAEELARALALPRARQLRRLSIPLWTDRASETVANAESLARLEALAIAVMPPYDHESWIEHADFAGQCRRLAMLARSQHLRELRELTVAGYLDENCLEVVIRNPIWRGLRKLDVRVRFWPDQIGPTDATDGLPELDELRLSVENYSAAQMAAFARCPLLKRLRHFAVHGGFSSAVAEIGDAVDNDRIETFAIGSWKTSLDVAAKLEKRFGDRFHEIT